MDRPYVILNAAMTVDGKIASVGGDSRISCPEDLRRLHRLRSRVDAVMIGAGTVLADDPALTVRRVRGKSPVRVVVDGRARVPPSARVFRRGPPVIVAVGSKAPKSKIERLKRVADVLQLQGPPIDLRELLSRLRSRGIKRLLLEGGSTLNWHMLRSGLVDEIRVSISPRIVGGENAKTLVGGQGFARIADGVRLRLLKIQRVGRDILLVYRVVGSGSAKNR
jgi:2,5-diamino-6-(ribosylamino)-4(3H)-pyrimidinone 5'-phosphate reductase